MKEEIDIMELIIAKMPEKTNEQKEIKSFMLNYKDKCNCFLYEKYKKETTFFNTILNSLTLDLGREITEVIYKDKVVKTKKDDNENVL